MSSLVSLVITVFVLFIGMLLTVRVISAVLSGVGMVWRGLFASQTKTRSNATRVRNSVAVSSRYPSNTARNTYRKSTSFSWASLPYLKFTQHEAPEIAKYGAFAAISPVLEGAHEVPSHRSAQSRYLPHIERTLDNIAVDNMTFNWNGVFAKPDGIFFDAEKNEYLVAEFKSAKFFGLNRMLPENIFQLLISAQVLRQSLAFQEQEMQKPAPTVRAFVRYDNRVIEISGWEEVMPRVFSLVPDLLPLLQKRSISSSNLARYYVLINDVFQRQANKTSEEAKVIGRYKHLLMTREKGRVTEQVSERVHSDQVLANLTPETV